MKTIKTLNFKLNLLPLQLKLDGLRAKKETGEKLNDEEERMLHEYDFVVIQLETMKELLEAFEEKEMAAKDMVNIKNLDLFAQLLQRFSGR